MNLDFKPALILVTIFLLIAFWGKIHGSGSTPPIKNKEGVASTQAVASLEKLSPPFQLVEEYFKTLQASKGKKLVKFEKSAYTPFFAETEKFNSELRRIKKQAYQ
ncbi:MAG TPA: hypothetical protein DCK76_03515 [Desulfotomaculum sp.]|nr:hypothetical protein [Desulfotomaculum sp.]HBY04782.1 hypothetical protein [Desulfotomaculum sp.]